MTLKNELQVTLDQATRGLGDLKAQAAREREEYEHKLHGDSSERDRIETSLRNSNLALETEVAEKGRQLEATRELFAKTRDQLRLDQSSLESLRTVNRRLTDELKGAQDELNAAREANEEQTKRAGESMALAQQAVSSSVSGGVL